MRTVRLTVGQAIVRFMAAQQVERDGHRERFIAGVWGIFGHGNVAGLGQAIEEYGDVYGLPYYRPQNEQAQVHLAHAFAKHSNRLRAFACISSVGPGATNMITGAAGATVNRIPVLLFPSDAFANRAPDPVLQQVEHPSERDVSANDAFRAVSRFFDRISRPEQHVETGAADVVVGVDDGLHRTGFGPASRARAIAGRTAGDVPARRCRASASDGSCEGFTSRA